MQPPSPGVEQPSPVEEEPQCFSEAEVDGPPAKRARRCVARESPDKKLEHLLAEFPSGPPDFGGRLAQLLWGVHLEYSTKVEYILLAMTAEERRQHKGARRIERPEIKALLRCSRSIRQGTIAGAKVRMLTMEPGAPATEHQDFTALCDTLRERYPSTWDSCVRT
mmetsp:Transcript_28056/g.70996  ORF Transcript_28056/g.70996 Transcript_28056/m.70996 type:complete len:165 (-) Transcript_28056:226-720(-)